MHSFFITEVLPEDQPKMQGFLFENTNLLGKMTLSVNDNPNGIIYPKFTLFKLNKFVVDKKYENDGNLENILNVSHSDIMNIQYLIESDYTRFKEKYLMLPYSLKDTLIGASGKTYYPINIQSITHQKGGIVIPGYSDPESDISSDLINYDPDGNYLHEDNSNPTNSDYFNKSDIDFLNN